MLLWQGSLLIFQYSGNDTGNLTGVVPARIRLIYQAANKKTGSATSRGLPTLSLMWEPRKRKEVH
jgi:hypothetical protein